MTADDKAAELSRLVSADGSPEHHSDIILYKDLAT